MSGTQKSCRDGRVELWGEAVADQLEQIEKWSSQPGCWPTEIPLITRLELMKAMLTLDAEMVEQVHGRNAGMSFRDLSYGAARMLECAEEYGSVENFAAHLEAGRFSETRVLGILAKHKELFSMESSS